MPTNLPEPRFSLEIRGLRKSFDRPAVDGLDLTVRAGEFYTLLGPNHVRAGGTVIMTTHILEVAERMADRIGVIARGRLIAEGTLEELRRHAGDSTSTLEDTFLTLVAGEAAAAAAA
jgi:ABC-type multidrug transport system ATPase subunit